MNTDKIRMTHVFELLRMAAHGTAEEQAAARVEYDRRIEAEPYSSYRLLRTMYFVATAHAFAVVQASAKVRFDSVTDAQKWFIPDIASDAPEA